MNNVRDIIAGVTIIGLVVNLIVSWKLSKNDIKHLYNQSATMFEKFDVEKRRTDKQGEDISYLKGQLKSLNTLMEKILNSVINGRRR